jgi:hypothetical protein
MKPEGKQVLWDTGKPLPGQHTPTPGLHLEVGPANKKLSDYSVDNIKPS